MSRLLLPNGDDHPEAARKHLLDAHTLLAQQRADGAAYLSGYVVECALKSLFALETGTALKGHQFSSLMSQVSALAIVAGARSARYLGVAAKGVLASSISGWKPEIRYKAPVMTAGSAQTWIDAARQVFQETVHQMTLDGVL